MIVIEASRMATRLIDSAIKRDLLRHERMSEVILGSFGGPLSLLNPLI